MSPIHRKTLIIKVDILGLHIQIFQKNPNVDSFQFDENK